MYPSAIRFTVAALLFLAAIVPVHTAPAQSRMVIRDSIGCAQCRIVLERVAELGAPRDPVLLDKNTRFVVAPDATRIFAAPTATPGVVAVYNMRGAPLSTIGRLGRGPGEFSKVWGATLALGRLHVIDEGGQRINVFGPGLAFERDIPLLDRLMDNDGILVIGNRIIVSSVFQNARSPAPVVILDDKGTRIHSVSPEPDTVPARRRYLAESTSDRFWAAPYNRYELQLWDTAGKQLRTIVREAPWFRSWSVATDITAMRPQTQLKSIREDAEGLLWVATLIPDPKWEPLRSARTMDDLDANRIYDSRLEVLDPRTGVVLARYTTDNEMRKVAGPEPMFSSYRSDANGYVSWTLYRARLMRPRQ